MSVEAISWALNEAPDVPPQCVAVLLGLANHAHANGRAAFPSQERLAHYTRKSVRSVQNDLKTLEGLGLIRRGDQRHVLFLPADRRPVVYELAMGRRRPLPGALDPSAEPQSGKPAEVPERGEADFTPVPDRGEAQYEAGRSVVPSGAKRASYEPSFNRQGTNRRASAREIPGSKSKEASPRGAALPVPAQAPDRCKQHPGQYAKFCGPCRGEEKGGA